MLSLSVRLLAVIVLAFSSGTNAQNASSSALEGRFNTLDVEIMVFGSPHLRQMDLDAAPIATSAVLSSLARFEPDLVVVESLHPSVDRETAFNYRSLGDLETLGRLWGYRTPERIAAAFETMSQLLPPLKEASLTTASARIELGKLYYLKGDQLNAGYQWWQAQRLGADVSDLRRLTRNNFKGHELEIWGFELARQGGHEYVTPFDYQGTDIGSEVWGQILDRLKSHAIRINHGVEEGDARWSPLEDAFDDARRAFEKGESRVWLDEYGDIPEIREYATTWEGFGLANAETPDDPDGLTRIRWWQGPEYERIERHVQYELIPGISIGNLGQARTDGNIRRNEHMADFAEADIRSRNARRVLVIVGYAHKHYLEDIFRERGYTIVESSRFVP